MSAAAAWSTLALVTVIFGLMPGLVLSLILRLFLRDDPRRDELHAELRFVPRWERPIWVMEQLEVALREGVSPRLAWWWGRYVWHRSALVSGAAMHAKHPDSFEVPEAEVKEQLRPGDAVKLMWDVQRMPEERMWVTITHRDGDRLVGTLNNWAIFAFLHPDENVKFHIDDIIDCIYEEDREADPNPGQPSVHAFHLACNSCADANRHGDKA